VFVAEDGSRETRANDLKTQLEFGQWNRANACEHEDGVYRHHHIGNVALVSFLRSTLQASGVEFPVTLERVVYNGVHAGDWLSVEQVSALRQDLEHMASLHLADEKQEELLRYFEFQLRDLVEYSVKLGKPIVF
jgi:hypothetical protein